MKAYELQQVRPGFDDPARGSQAVFRTCLEALSRPGQIMSLDTVAAGAPVRGLNASALVLLAMVDSDCVVWLSSSLSASDVRPWLQFHTGCHWTECPGDADFLWVAQGDALPSLSLLKSGSSEYPETSATCVVEVLSMQSGALAAIDEASEDVWVMSGPGIERVRSLCIDGLPDDFARQWAANGEVFPRGVDVMLTAGMHLMGLPRTTRIGTPEIAARNVPEGV